VRVGFLPKNHTRGIVTILQVSQVQAITGCDRVPGDVRSPVCYMVKETDFIEFIAGWPNLIDTRFSVAL
jgi:hypothetical protein